METGAHACEVHLNFNLFHLLRPVRSIQDNWLSDQCHPLLLLDIVTWIKDQEDVNASNISLQRMPLSQGSGFTVTGRPLTILMDAKPCSS